MEMPDLATPGQQPLMSDQLPHVNLCQDGYNIVVDTEHRIERVAVFTEGALVVSPNPRAVHAEPGPSSSRRRLSRTQGCDLAVTCA